MELPEGAQVKAPRGFMSPGAFFCSCLPFPLPGESFLGVHDHDRRPREGRNMKMILTEEEVSLWKLLFMISFLALLIFMLVQTAPSAEVQYGETLFIPSP